ncbi:hypothetical protein [Paenibacillus tyrfis]|uniref:Uncharacterized protein n=1 Tax=Paenibacillus tyrfis TaxID=1501230 RepID=A0A081P4D9_9BACL|nr:hypothetical protein [Paenibacillus tyrfis]KEQ25562.1 hypothetical protein ET33_02240 [Paenibacillus tyrfis]
MKKDGVRMENKAKWKREYLFVMRDENGVLIRFSEITPEDYVDPVDEEITDETRFRVVEE